MAGTRFRAGRFRDACDEVRRISPPLLDWDRIDADIVVLGAPFDSGTHYRAGAGTAHGMAQEDHLAGEARRSVALLLPSRSPYRCCILE